MSKSAFLLRPGAGQSYLSDLRIRAAEKNAAFALAKSENRLINRVARWYGALPKSARKAAYSIRELANEFRAARGELGPVLHQLGWKRKRRWTGGGPYERYWVPPMLTAESSEPHE